MLFIEYIPLLARLFDKKETVPKKNATPNLPCYPAVYGAALDAFLDNCDAYAQGKSLERPAAFHTLLVNVTSGEISTVFQDLGPISVPSWYFIGTSGEIDTVERRLHENADAHGSSIRVGRGELTCKRREGDVFVPYSVDKFIDEGFSRTGYRFSSLPSHDNYYNYPAQKVPVVKLEVLAA